MSLWGQDLLLAFVHTVVRLKNSQFHKGEYDGYL